MLAARRHAEQGEARRQRDPRRVDGGGPRRGDELGLPLYKYLGGPNARVLPVPLMNIINGGAHADNTLDFQEFMIVPGRRQLLRGAARRRRGVPHAQEGAARAQGCRPRVGDEGGFAPDLPGAEAALERHRRGHREGRLQARQGRRPGARRRVERAVRQDRQDLQASRRRGQGARRARDGRRSTRKLCEKYPIVLDRGRHGRERLGRLEGADRGARRAGAARRRRPLRHQHRAHQARASTRASRTRSWSR